MKIIDAHSHLAGDDQQFLDLLESYNVQSYNICVARVGMTLDDQRQAYRSLAHAHPERYQWISSFEVPTADDFAHPLAYADRCIKQLDQDFADGAIACKIWKNIGMEIQTPDGSFFHSDHDILTPIFEHIASCGKPVLAHLGEPYACWQPLEFESPHAGYYKNNPKWHMYEKHDMPGHSEIMDAFDRLLARHPHLQFVGAHLGSLEYDLNAMANRFDRFPNFAVDTGARNYDFAYHDRDECRAFFERYHERILFGIDISVPLAERQEPEFRVQVLDSYRTQLEEAIAFFTTDQPVNMLRKTVTGLALSHEISENLFFANAERWYKTPVYQ